ncbi:MAG TPA: hypothetical protein VN213_08780 [Solirubrobacteraceae bacterium]|nr:hypothetical protein [Solirubrobacteraceae bacterium]
MPPAKLTIDHLDILSGIEEARAALDSIVDDVSAAVAREWGAPVRGPRGTHGYFERAYRPGPAWRRDTEFLWASTAEPPSPASAAR